MIVCLFCQPRIPHLGSEIQFIDDMVDSHVHVGEQGHMFTTLKVGPSPFAEVVRLLHLIGYVCVETRNWLS